MIHVEDFTQPLRMADIMMDAPPPRQRRMPIDLRAEKRKAYAERMSDEAVAKTDWLRLRLAVEAMKLETVRERMVTWFVLPALAAAIVIGSVLAAMAIDGLIMHCLWPFPTPELASLCVDGGEGIQYDPTDFPPADWMTAPRDGA